MKLARLALASSILLSLAAVVAGCGSRDDDADKQILLFGNGAEPEGLDPHIVTGVPEHHILSSLYEGLVNLDAKDLSPLPGVAESWEISDDALTYTFHLRKDAKWSNGDPVTSKDFMYAWRRILTPSLASEYAYMLHCMKNAQAYNEGKIADFSQVGCEAPDDYTLVVSLAFPTPYFMTLHIHYTWFPVHQATIEKFGAMDDRDNRWIRPENIVTNGEFTLERWEPNNVIVTAKNPLYWNAKNVALDEVHFFPTVSWVTEERMFRAGELHMTENLLNTKVETYQKNNPDVLHMHPWLGSYFFRINVTKPPLNDVRVRRALALAVDRKTIVTKVKRSGELPAYFLTPPGMNGYFPEKYVPYDVKKAQKLLAEAGYPGGRDFPDVDLLYNTSENHQQICEAIQQMWKKNLGIEVTLSNQDWKVYLDSTNRLDYDIARAGWIGDFVDPINFLECFTTGNGNNRCGYSSKEYDALIEKARRTAGIDERNALYHKAEKILMTDMPLIPVYIYTRAYLMSTRVKGRLPNLIDYIAFEQLSLAPESEGE